MRECSAFTLSGERCRAKPQRNSSFCFTHDPGKLLERRSANRRGGLAAHRIDGRPSKPHPVDTTEAVLGLLATAAGDILSRKPGLARARALCYLATTAFKGLEVGAHEERIAAIEAQMAAQAPKPRLTRV